MPCVEIERDEQIREVAYRIWQEAGCPHGYDVQHWLEAESTCRIKGKAYPGCYSVEAGGSEMAEKIEIKWLQEPEEHDYPAAKSFLSLLYKRRALAALVDKLKRAPITQFKAKDVFRASGLSLLGVSNSHVEKDRAKILAGEKLSPIILVRDKLNSRVIIADGYHRMCAVYSFDEDAFIDCKIV